MLVVKREMVYSPGIGGGSFEREGVSVESLW